MLHESAAVWVQRGRAVRAPDLYSKAPSPAISANSIVHGSPEFKSSATLVNSQLVCLRPVGILNPAMLDFIIMNFMCLLGPAGISAINTTEGKQQNFLYSFFFFEKCMNERRTN